MSDDLDTVRALFRAVEARDLDAVLACYDESIEIHEDRSLPYGGTYRGHEGAVRQSVAFVETWGPFQGASERRLDPVLLEGDGGTVLALFRHRAVDQASGRRLDAAEVGVYDVREGKVVRSQMFHESTAALLAFLGGAAGEGEATMPMLLVAELAVRDPEALMRYASRVQPLMARHGGRIAGVSAAGAHVLEGDWRPGLLVVHRWRSRADFDAFWSSDDYAPLRRLRHSACDSRIAVFDAVVPEPAGPDRAAVPEV